MRNDCNDELYFETTRGKLRPMPRPPNLDENQAGLSPFNARMRFYYKRIMAANDIATLKDLANFIGLKEGTVNSAIKLPRSMRHQDLMAFCEIAGLSAAEKNELEELWFVERIEIIREVGPAAAALIRAGLRDKTPQERRKIFEEAGKSYRHGKLGWRAQKT